MTKLSKISVFLGMLGLALAIVGGLGGNALIGISHGVILLSIVLLGIYQLGSKQKRMASPFGLRASGICLILILITFAASVLLNWSSYDRPFRDLKKLRYEAITLLLLIIPQFRAVFYRRESVMKWAFWVAWGSAVAITIAGGLGLLTGFNPLLGSVPKVAGRLGGVSGSQMTFGYTLQFFVLLVASLIVAEFKGIRWLGLAFRNQAVRYGFLGLTFLILFAGLYLSYCRGALFSVGFGFLVILMCSRSMRIWITAGVIVLGTAAVSFQSGARYSQYFKHGFNLDGGDTLRVTQWKAASLAFLQNPVKGLGHRQFEKQSDVLKEKYGFPPRYKGGYFRGHAHNNYLEAFASNGIFGGLAFIAFCLFWFYELYKSSHAKLYFLPVVVAFIVSGFFECTFTDSEVLHTILLLYFFSQVALDHEVIGNR